MQLAHLSALPARLGNELRDRKESRELEALAVFIQCIKRLWLGQQQPHAPAVTFAERSLTYGVEQQSNLLAHDLIARGIAADKLTADTSENVVALGFYPSEAMIVAILAVLKAGAAYLPLDPESPDSRLAFMLEDSKAKCLLTSKDLFPSKQQVITGLANANATANATVNKVNHNKKDNAISYRTIAIDAMTYSVDRNCHTITRSANSSR